MRSFSHWTPRYLADRFKLALYETTHRGSPWLTKDMVEILAKRLRPDNAGLEWGAGRSTIWFARRVGRLVSIEHDESWHQQVSHNIMKNGLLNVDCFLCKDENEYAKGRDVPPESLDFILIDGIARDQCAVTAISLLKPGGMLIVDNSNWYLPGMSRAPHSRRPPQGAASQTWELFLREVKGWHSIWTTNGVWDTTLWIKPYAGS